MRKAINFDIDTKNKAPVQDNLSNLDDIEI